MNRHGLTRIQAFRITKGNFFDNPQILIIHDQMMPSERFIAGLFRGYHDNISIMSGSP